MNISGVLVHARPGHIEEVRRGLAALEGVEVHAAAPHSRLIVPVEEADGTVGKTILEIERLPGVLAAALVYQQSDPDPDLRYEEACDATHTA